MTTPSQFENQHERMTEAADQAYDATQDFARAANGNNGHIIPAPTAYTILGNTKGMLRHITESQSNDQNLWMVLGGVT